MASQDLRFDVFALDRASKTFITLSRRVEQLADKLDKLDRKDANPTVNVDVDRGLRSISNFADNSSSILSGAMKIVSANAIIMGAVVVAAIAAAPAAAVLAASGIVFAFGGALAAIGIVAAAQNKKVKHAFTDLKDHVVETTKQISKPFIGTLLSIADTARKTFDAFVPALRGSFKILAPAVSQFADMFGMALQQLSLAFKPLSRAFAAFTRAFGPVLVGVFSDIADSLIDLSRVVRRNDKEFAGFVGGVLKLIPLTIRAIAKLAGWFVNLKNTIKRWAKENRGDIARFKRGVVQIWRALKRTVVPIVKDIADEVRKNWGPLKRWAQRNFRIFVGIIRDALRIIRILWRRHGDGIIKNTSTAFRILGRTIQGSLRFIRGVVRVVLGLIRGDWRQTFRGLRDITRTNMQVTGGVVGLALGLIRSNVANRLARIRDTWTRVWNLLPESARNALTRVGSAVLGVLGNLAGQLFSTGQDIIRGLIGGIRSMAGAAAAAAGDAVMGAVNAAKSKLGIKSPSKVFRDIGRNVVRGLKEGLLDKTEKAQIRSAVNSIVQDATTALNRALDKLDTALAARRDIVGQVTGGFTSSIFGATRTTKKGEEVPITGVGGLVKFQKQERHQARRVNRSIRELIDKGLSRSLVRQLLSQGEAGQAQLFTLADDASRKQLRRLNRLNRQRAVALRRAGMAPGNLLVGERIARAREKVREKRDAKRDAEIYAREFIRMLNHEGLVLRIDPDGIVRLVRRNVRTRGGNVQKVLGSGRG